VSARAQAVNSWRVLPSCEESMQRIRSRPIDIAVASPEIVFKR
jgi:hypothetical protein